ncbi:MAG: hypothetical protein WCT19_00820 [Candidatus Paceibacterota bacterium]
MDSKKIIWLGMGVGSFIGSFIPSLWGSGVFSFSSVIFTAVGGILGIWVAVKLTN